ncbi:VOC family protein [Amycolatopsis anabasis]|uniref:VOC family protein n=1 Tax=Amycolatopsis anabasis TaxID=1840409 RepID=UPI00131CFBB6|nr:VOC family protein [Amycolatopsis anabasis]
MVLPVTGVNELMLEVHDLERAERFYTEVLGFPVLLRWEGEFWRGREAVWLLAGNTRIGLVKPALGIARARPGVHVHFAMHVEDADYDELVRGLRERGAEVDEVTFGTEGSVNARSAYVIDPDQHVVEFWTWDATRGDTGIPTAVTPGVYGL